MKAIRVSWLTCLIMVTGMQTASAQHAYLDLLHARDTLIQKEQKVQEMRDITQARIDRLKAQLDVQQQRLDVLNVQLDKLYGSVEETDEALKSIP